MFSLALMPSGTATGTDYKNMEQCIKEVVHKWRDLHLSVLGPNIHAVEDHLLHLFKKWKGIGDFVEDFIE